MKLENLMLELGLRLALGLGLGLSLGLGLRTENSSLAVLSSVSTDAR